MYNQPKLKICGMRDKDNVKALLDVGLDFMGFICYDKSARYVAEKDLGDIAQLFDNQLNTQKIGVFVNAGLEFILKMNQVMKFDIIQLHGQESPEFCAIVRSHGFKVMKAFAVDRSFDFGQLNAYQDVCDYYLFDTKGALPGGNGIQFDWSLLAAYHGDIPFFLGGGVDPNSVGKLQVFRHSNFFAIDANSGFEIYPALKDVDKILEFKEQYYNCLTPSDISDSQNKSK